MNNSHKPIIIEIGINAIKNTNLLPDLKPKQYIESSQIAKIDTNKNDIPKFKPVILTSYNLIPRQS